MVNSSERGPATYFETTEPVNAAPLASVEYDHQLGGPAGRLERHVVAAEGATLAGNTPHESVLMINGGQDVFPQDGLFANYRHSKQFGETFRDLRVDLVVSQDARETWVVSREVRPARVEPGQDGQQVTIPAERQFMFTEPAAFRSLLEHYSSKGVNPFDLPQDSRGFAQTIAENAATRLSEKGPAVTRTGNTLIVSAGSDYAQVYTARSEAERQQAQHEAARPRVEMARRTSAAHRLAAILQRQLRG